MPVSGGSAGTDIARTGDSISHCSVVNWASVCTARRVKIFCDASGKNEGIARSNNACSRSRLVGLGGCRAGEVQVHDAAPAQGRHMLQVGHGVEFAIGKMWHREVESSSSYVDEVKVFFP